jgi:MscS family membrane protein
MRVLAWFQTQDFGEFLMIRHRMLLDFIQVVERHGSSFALPSRTVYHVTSGGVTAPTGPLVEPLGPVAE